MFGFGSRQQTANSIGSDRDAWATAHSKTTVRTVGAIKDFQKVSEADLAREEREVKEMQQHIQRFQKFVATRLKREALDVEATKTLQNYQAELAKSLVEKQAAVTAKQIALEKLRLPQARMQQTLADTRQQIDLQIADLQQKQQSLASKRGWSK